MTRCAFCLHILRLWQWINVWHVDGPLDPTIGLIWRPNQHVVLWRAENARFVCLSVSRFMLVVGLPLERPGLRIAPERVRFAGGPFALNVWRDEPDIYQEEEQA